MLKSLYLGLYSVKKLAATAQKTSISTQTPLPCPVICFGIFAVHSTCPPRVAIWEFMAPDQPTTLSLRQSLSVCLDHIPPFLLCGRFPAYLLIFTTSDVPSFPLHNVFEIRIGWMNETYFKINSAAHVCKFSQIQPNYDLLGKSFS